MLKRIFHKDMKMCITLGQHTIKRPDHVNTIMNFRVPFWNISLISVGTSSP
jgi:hypothetical protein